MSDDDSASEFSQAVSSYISTSVLSESARQNDIRRLEGILQQLIVEMEELQVRLGRSEGESKFLLEQLLPQIRGKADEVQRVFFFIDELEKTVGRVATAVAEAEVRVKDTEAAYNELYPTSVDKVLSVFRLRGAGAGHESDAASARAAAAALKCGSEIRELKKEAKAKEQFQ